MIDFCNVEQKVHTTYDRIVTRNVSLRPSSCIADHSDTLCSRGHGSWVDSFSARFDLGYLSFRVASLGKVSVIMVMTLSGWAFIVLLQAYGKGFAGASSPRTVSEFRNLQGMISSPAPEAASNVVVFGTYTGYDAGGCEPICWESQIPGTGQHNFNATNKIELLNQKLFEQGDIQMLTMCYEGTNLTMKPLSFDASRTMLYDHTYTAQLDLQVDLAKLNRNIIPEQMNAPEHEVYFRLHLCDAIRQGFCNPILDTRNLDTSLTREESDEDTSLGPFRNDALKWEYRDNSTLFGLTNPGNNMTIFGRWCRWRLINIQGTSIYTTRIFIAFQVREPPGVGPERKPFFFIGHAVFGLDTRTNGVDGPGIRFDIAQAIPDMVVFLKPQPKILKVSTACIIGISVAIAVVCSFALYCLKVIIMQRQHTIMRIAQGTLLAIMTASCFVQSFFAFTFIPRETFCALRGPLVLVPITLVASVLVGRAWRAYRTLSSVNSFGRGTAMTPSRAQDLFVQLLNALALIGHRSKEQSQGLRSAVSEKDSMVLITMLTLPQVALQIVSAVIHDGGVIMEFTPVGDIGREICSREARWVVLTGTAYATFVYILAFLMAWISRDLPSIFNEKDQIFNTSMIAAIFTAITIGLGEVIDQPTTTPDAEVIHDYAVLNRTIITPLNRFVFISAPTFHMRYLGDRVNRFDVNRMAKSTKSTDRRKSCCEQSPRRKVHRQD